ncbi:MAG: sigma-70 family RNA polymerase sigma factor [Polyangiaceae bacterium]|nr:sigma-70 family RNA polymerase sigma factor [Polyangiaceae bacterium]
MQERAPGHRETAGPDAADARAFVLEHADFVFRSLRRLGLGTAAAEDAAQQVFMIAVTKVAHIEPGKEKVFLFGVLSNVARHARRSFARNLEDLARREPAGADPWENPRSEADGPEEALLEAEARRVLDRILASMADDLRDVFVMAELEEMTMADIAVALEIPPGTVASRLRRARAWFEQAAASIDEEGSGGTP